MTHFIGFGCVRARARTIVVTVMVATVVPSLVIAVHFLASQRALRAAAARVRSLGPLVAGDMQWVSLREADWNDREFTEVAEAMRPCGGPETLDLFHTNVGDDSMELLVNMHRLRCVNLGRTRVTDRGVDILSRSPSITTLLLGDTALTDKGMRALCRAPKLRRVAFSHTAVTEDGVKALVEAHPDIVLK